MTTRKKKTEVPEDCMPKCENCNAGVFAHGEDLGECRLLPMDWVVVEGDPTPMWKPAYRTLYCKHFDRKVN